MLHLSSLQNHQLHSLGLIFSFPLMTLNCQLFLSSASFLLKLAFLESFITSSFQLILGWLLHLLMPASRQHLADWIVPFRSQNRANLPQTILFHHLYQCISHTRSQQYFQHCSHCLQILLNTSFSMLLTQSFSRCTLQSTSHSMLHSHTSWQVFRSCLTDVNYPMKKNPAHWLYLLQPWLHLLTTAICN